MVLGIFLVVFAGGDIVALVLILKILLESLHLEFELLVVLVNLGLKSKNFIVGLISGSTLSEGTAVWLSRLAPATDLRELREMINLASHGVD